MDGKLLLRPVAGLGRSVYFWYQPRLITQTRLNLRLSLIWTFGFENCCSAKYPTPFRWSLLLVVEDHNTPQVLTRIEVGIAAIYFIKPVCSCD
jgi:hypothetical protein